MENAIIAQNIKRYFKAGDGTTVHALDGVSMEIKKGTLAILKGRSGSGKTTLLNILSALDMPTEGSVQFLDKNLEQMTEKDREMLRRYEMGFVFQSIALIPTMTAYENVEFALRLAKNDVINENTHDRVSELLDAAVYFFMNRVSGQSSEIDSLCVIMIRVLFCEHSRRFAISAFSVSASRAEVGSSRSRMPPCLSRALAMAILWACPSLRPAPDSPHTVFRPSGRDQTKSAIA